MQANPLTKVFTMSEFRPADARLAVHRRIRALFVDVLSEEGPLSVEDEQFADDLSAELLDVLGLVVTGVDDDGSMTVHLTLEDD